MAGRSLAMMSDEQQRFVFSAGGKTHVIRDDHQTVGRGARPGICSSLFALRCFLEIEYLLSF
jgi:hypothetical protein